jgi:hypothetical protein
MFLTSKMVYCFMKIRVTEGERDEVEVTRFTWYVTEDGGTLVACLWFIHNCFTMGWLSMDGALVVGGSHNRVICEVTLSSPCLWASFHPPIPSFTWYPQRKKILLNLSMKCRNSTFNAQGTRVIIVWKKSRRERWLFQYFASATGFLVPCPPPPMTKSHTLC